MAFPDFQRRSTLSVIEEEECSPQRSLYNPTFSSDTGGRGYGNQDWRRQTQVPWFEEEYVSAIRPHWSPGLWPGDPINGDSILLGWMRRHPQPPPVEDVESDAALSPRWHTGLYSAEPTGPDLLAWMHHRQPSQEEPDWYVAWQSRWRPGAVVEPTGVDSLVWARKRTTAEDVPELAALAKRWNVTLDKLQWDQITWARRRRATEEPAEDQTPVRRWHTGLWTAEPTGPDQLIWRKPRQLSAEDEEYAAQRRLWHTGLVPPVIVVDAMAWARKRSPSEPDAEWIVGLAPRSAGMLYVMPYGLIPGPYFVAAMNWFQPGTVARVVVSQ